MKKPKLELRQKNDSQDMSEAIKTLSEKGYKIVRKTPYQLKIGPFNFWPDTGRIHIDGKSKMTKRGLEDFIDLLPAPQTRPATISLSSVFPQTR